ncbi:MAG: hypothetical protein R2883_03605 [Caldisericia bacterium]
MNWIDYVILIVAIWMAIRLYAWIIWSPSNTIATLIGWVSALLLAAPVKNLLQALFGWVSSLAGYIAPATPGKPIPGGTDPLQSLQAQVFQSGERVS